MSLSAAVGHGGKKDNYDLASSKLNKVPYVICLLITRCSINRCFFDPWTTALKVCCCTGGSTNRIFRPDLRGSVCPCESVRYSFGSTGGEPDGRCSAERYAGIGHFRYASVESSVSVCNVVPNSNADLVWKLTNYYCLFINRLSKQVKWHWKKQKISSEVTATCSVGTENFSPYCSRC